MKAHNFGAGKRVLLRPGTGSGESLKTFLGIKCQPVYREQMGIR